MAVLRCASWFVYLGGIPIGVVGQLPVGVARELVVLVVLPGLGVFFRTGAVARWVVAITELGGAVAVRGLGQPINRVVSVCARTVERLFTGEVTVRVVVIALVDERKEARKAAAKLAQKRVGKQSKHTTCKCTNNKGNPMND